MDIPKINIAETFTVTGDWNTLSGKLRDKYAQLTDADLKFESGKEDDLVSRIANRLGKNKTDVIQLLETVQLAMSNPS